mmetsp:Transcript_589/g.1161  ORF Transcript_589/g.1161 Transcript_589/m.1161 type:complete len:213 (-) Transcript_589:50-688(-)|eukprot:CAMPEP_0172300692 /NCGR_PEP_ID=MMETSP1058-20130122/2721_1 /TAXON_ID=83371 /ORGANISM="Detonula confervacea, Strain CCMP 353" /LENGTH=212 /DNA_ID=CAMNT_0013010537 /DNA_START=19 /DNA_END=657 /DNA_ORIENTATION=-
MISSSKTLLAFIGFTVASASELKVDVYEGPTECEDAQRVSAGNNLSMHYTGTIDQSSETGEKGKQFDSSRDRGQTFDVVIGTGQVIKGWDQGIVGLCVGAKANLVIPPELGYGAQGAGGAIPGGATLHFDVEVVAINADAPAADVPNLFEEIDTDSDGKISKDEVGAYFKAQGQDEVPDELWQREDTDSDGFISWAEFSGPKGTENPMGDEL